MFQQTPTLLFLNFPGARDAHAQPSHSGDQTPRSALLATPAGHHHAKKLR